MARFIADQNKVLFQHESGTYGTTSGNAFWIGEVTENSIDDSEGLIETRYLGNLNRNIVNWQQGPRDATGTLTYNAQNMQLIFLGMGSVASTSGPQAHHRVTEIQSDAWQSPFASGTGQLNPPISFTIEDSKQAAGTGRNMIRTIKGTIPNVTTITATQGEKIVVSMDYMGQTLTHSSGATTSVTAQTGRAYRWSDCSVDLIDTAGNTSGLDTLKEAVLEINQNRTGPHYLNGSRDISTPFNGNRDYTFTLTMDLDGDDADTLYNKFYKGGSKFNMEFDIDADVSTAGSQHTEFLMSGCYIVNMENPSVLEGTTESVAEIRPGSLFAQEWTNANTLTFGKFTPW
jgi:hypothetical protein